MTGDELRDELLGPSGMRALSRERAKNKELKATLHNLRSAVIECTNALVDVVERDGAVRTHKEGAE